MGLGSCVMMPINDDGVMMTHDLLAAPVRIADDVSTGCFDVSCLLSPVTISFFLSWDHDREAVRVGLPGQLTPSIRTHHNCTPNHRRPAAMSLDKLAPDDPLRPIWELALSMPPNWTPPVSNPPEVCRVLVNVQIDRAKRQIDALVEMLDHAFPVLFKNSEDVRGKSIVKFWLGAATDVQALQYLPLPTRQGHREQGHGSGPYAGLPREVAAMLTLYDRARHPIPCRVSSLQMDCLPAGVVRDHQRMLMITPRCYLAQGSSYMGHFHPALVDGGNKMACEWLKIIYRSCLCIAEMNGLSVMPPVHS